MTNDTLKRLLKQVLIGLAIGAPLGFAFGLGVFDHFLNLSEATVLTSITILVWCLIALITLLAVFLYLKVMAELKSYQATEDDEASDQLYRTLNKRYAYLLVTVTVGLILSLFLVLLTFRVNTQPDTASLEIPIVAYLSLLAFAVFHMFVLKSYQALRGVKIPLLPTVKEVKNNILQQDEAELQANYKMSFEIVMNLSNIILPAIYIVLFFLTQVTQELQLSAFLVTVTVHLYIMLMQVKMAKDFYR